MNRMLKNPPQVSRMNTFLRTVCMALLGLSLAANVYNIASIPRFYQRSVTLTLPDASISGMMQSSNENVLQQAASRGMSIEDYSLYRIVRDLVYASGFFIVAFLIVLRARGQWFVWFTALILVMIPSGQLHFYSPQDSDLNRYLMWLGLLWPGYPLFLYLFPNGRAVPRWILWLLAPVLLFHLFGQGTAALAVTSRGQVNLTPEVLKYAWIMVLSFPLALASQVYRYLRASTQEERLQTKWVVGGLVVVILTGVILPVLLNQNDMQGDYGFTSDFSILMTLFLPVTIGISILRYRLYDIDLIIRRTLQYGILSVLLGMVYFGLVVLLGQAFQGATGQQSPLVIVLSTLAIAALFTPLRRRVQEVIDRRFFRSRYNAEQVLQRFVEWTRSQADMAELSDHLLTAVNGAVEPQAIGLWLRSPKSQTMADDLPLGRKK